MPSTRRTKLAATAAHKARRVRKPVLSDKARKNAQRACLGWARRSVKNDLAKMRAAAAQMAGVRGATLYHAEYLRCLEQEIARLETAAVVQQAAPVAVVQQTAPVVVVQQTAPVAPMPEAVGEVDGGVNDGGDDEDQDGDTGQVQDANPGDDGQDDEGQDQDGDEDQDGDDDDEQDSDASEDEDANAGDEDQDDAGDDGAPRGMPMKVCLCCGGLVPQTARWCFNSGRKKRACKPPSRCAGRRAAAPRASCTRPGRSNWAGPSSITAACYHATETSLLGNDQ